MAASGSSSSSKELDQTPTWAVAAVCTVFILISITLEKSLHKLGTWLGKKQKKDLLEALDKVKAELMILGFISLLLTFGQSYIVKICISSKVAKKMLPCAYDYKEHRRHLLPFERRYLAADTTSYKCNREKKTALKLLNLVQLLSGKPQRGLNHGGQPQKLREVALVYRDFGFTVALHFGHEPLLSVNGLHQLHILIFFLAVVHVIYIAITMLLGRLKIRGWKAWEAETSTHGYEFANDASRFRLSHETSFVRAHTSFWIRMSILFYIGCFFRQFYRSVRKADYLTVRNGFITDHLAPGTKFNFQKYIKRSLEDDFKVVVGVSPVLWASVVVLLLLNINGWRTTIWATLIPVIMILAVGTQLQAILAKMALQITERHAVVQGMPLVQGSDENFWFGQPQLVLHLIHFALFQNAFQITFVLWTWYSGLEDCFRVDYRIAIIKVATGFVMLCLCSYITLPLYALVSQMGTNIKHSIFNEQTSNALKKWHNAAKGKHGTAKLGKSTAPSMDRSTLGSTANSPGHVLRRFKTTGHSTRSSAYEYEDQDHEYESDIELSSISTRGLLVRVDNDEQQEEEPHHSEGETNNELGDFTFAKPGLVERTTT